MVWFSSKWVMDLHIEIRNVGLRRKGTEVNMCFMAGVWELARDPGGVNHDYHRKFRNGEPDI